MIGKAGSSRRYQAPPDGLRTIAALVVLRDTVMMTPRGHVLVVDDNPDIVAFLSDLLALEGYHVHAAVGDLVLPLDGAVRPDLILLDAHMPGLDGAALSRLLRADPCTTAIPRVAVTADPDLRARTAEMGAVAAVGKPFEFPTLLCCVARWAGPGTTSTASLPHTLTP